MSRVGAEVKASMKQWYRNKGTLFWTLLFPVMLILIFGAIFGRSGNPQFELYIQNQDLVNGSPTPLSKAFVDMLNMTDPLPGFNVDEWAKHRKNFTVFNIHMVGSSENINKTLATVTGNPRAVVIPSGFSEAIIGAVRGGKPASVLLIYDKSQVSDPVPGIVRNFVTQFNRIVAAGGPTAEVVNLADKAGAKNFKYVDFFVPGIVAMTIMTTGLIGAITVNTEYRANGVLRKLATTPLSKLEWVLGIVLFQTVLGFVAAAIILLTGYTVFGVAASLNIASVILITTGAVAFPGMGMIIARFVKDPKAADAAGNAISFPMMFLAGTFFPIEFMPDFLQPISRVLPLTYLSNGLRDAMVNGNIPNAFFSAGVMAVLAVVFIISGTLLTDWREK